MVIAVIHTKIHTQNTIKKLKQNKKEPRVQEVHGDVVFCCSSLQKPKIQASKDSIQATEHALDQPGKDRMQILIKHACQTQRRLFMTFLKEQGCKHANL